MHRSGEWSNVDGIGRCLGMIFFSGEDKCRGKQLCDHNSLSLGLHSDEPGAWSQSIFQLPILEIDRYLVYTI